jgi:hypothetical protein
MFRQDRVYMFPCLSSFETTYRVLDGVSLNGPVAVHFNRCDVASAGTRLPPTIALQRAIYSLRIGGLARLPGLFSLRSAHKPQPPVF